MYLFIPLFDSLYVYEVESPAPSHTAQRRPGARPSQSLVDAHRIILQYTKENESFKGLDSRALEELQVREPNYNKTCNNNFEIGNSEA